MNLGLEPRRAGESSAKPAGVAGAGGVAASPARAQPRKGPYDDDLVTARRYFYAGFLALPLLWFFMAVHYYSLSRKRDAPKSLRTYVNLAALGSLLFLAATVAWVTYFVQHWDKKQALYDLMVVQLPLRTSAW
jgi:hypothetical protein